MESPQSCSSTLVVPSDTKKPDSVMDKTLEDKICVQKIYEYNVAKQMKHNSSVLVVGPRDSGKSTSIRHMAYEMKLKQIHVVTGSHKDQEFHQQYIPHKNVLHGWLHEEQSIVDMLIENQRKQRKASNMIAKQQTCDEKHTTLTTTTNSIVHNGLREAAIVFDSFGYDNNVMNCKQLKDLVMNGRVYNTWVGITLQCGQQLPKQLRWCMDVLFLFGTRSRDERMFLYKHYTSIFSSFQQFNEYFDACTSGGRAMVIDNTVNSNELTDKVFWYNPKQDLPKFIVGGGSCTEAGHQERNQEHTNEINDESFSNTQHTCSFPSSIKSVFSCLSFWVAPPSRKYDH